ncbi:MAG: cation diffusion facilitator family transporter [bacterium]
MITMLLNFIITIAQIVGGVISGSLALISDAMHNFSDGISVIISFIALKLKSRENSPTHTFGLKRAEILAAVINAVVLIVIYIFLFYEAVQRFFAPQKIEPGLMSIVAIIGLLANIVGALLLKRDAQTSINIKSSYLHLLSDSVSSVAVVLGGVAIALWNIMWIDPMLTILIGIYIFRQSYSILSDAIHVLMEGAPPDISIEEIKKLIEKIPGVDNLHHIHLWMVGDNDVHLEAHLNVKDMMISESDKLRGRVEEILHQNFNINHITLQFECNLCPGNELIHQHK